MTTHRQADVDTALEVLLWAIEHFQALDEANAKLHCAPVRYSPITFRCAQAYSLLGVSERIDLPLVVMEVLSHVDAYELDPGR